MGGVGGGGVEAGVGGVERGVDGGVEGGVEGGVDGGVEAVQVPSTSRFTLLGTPKGNWYFRRVGIRNTFRLRSK